MELKERIALVEKQEQMLQFTSFSNEEAWKLGKLFVSYILDQKMPVAVCIKTLNGKTLFQFTNEGANFGSQSWIDRKFRTVQEFETSTLGYALYIKSRGATLVDRGLDPTKYVACGGGFPIVVKDAGLVGAAIISGLTDVEDHAVLIHCLSEYLGVSGVPDYPINL